MNVLVFHGYLLRGTGSNVYNAELVPALVALGHEVHLLAQDRHPEDLPWVDAVGTWGKDGLGIEVLREPVRCTVYRPELGGLLPVYVADRYAATESRPFVELGEDELDRYLAANVAAVREVVARARPEAALANHLVAGPAILARALDGVPYAVKVHGSALEYTVKRDPDRFLPLAREGVHPAGGVLVGSAHTAESLWAALDDAGVREKTRLGPPGVDLEVFRPRPEAQARAEVGELAREIAARPPSVPTGSSFDRDETAVGAALTDLARGLEGDDRLVTFVGKLIVSKGVDLLLAAWPLVLAEHPRARLAVVGFGAYRDALEELAAALGRGDLGAVRALAAEGRAAEGGERSELRMLLAFLDALEADAARTEQYLEAAARVPERVVWVGRLEHSELARVLPACEAQVVPSTFPEAFGMVAAEAAACGALPVSAAHSGLAEVSRGLAEGVPAAARPWLSFALGPDAVEHLAARLRAWLGAPPALRAEVREVLAREAAARFGWAGVARGVVAAAQGRLSELPRVPVDG